MGEDFLMNLVTAAGPIGPLAVGIGIVVLVIVLGLKWSGFGVVFGSKKTVVDDGQITAVRAGIASIDAAIEKIEHRMTVVEGDVEKRATREEMHRMELAFTRMEGRFEGVLNRVEATSNGVSRIEEFMYEAALRAKGER